jgi:hypothetical protein
VRMGFNLLSTLLLLLALSPRNTVAQTDASKPPISEETYSSTMKQIASTFRSLQINNKAMNHTDGEREAGRLARWFADIQGYWEAKKIKDAVAEAQIAIDAAREIESASKSMNMSTLDDAEKRLAGTCQNCHNAHRETLADGTFRIR